MPQRLRVNEILTVGLVDKGDDPESFIELWKRADEEEVEKRIMRRGDEFCVMTEDGSETLGCHGTLEDARAQLRAVEANKSDTRGMIQKILDLLKDGGGDESHEEGDGTMADDTYDVSKIEDEELRTFVESLVDRVEKSEARVEELEDEVDKSSDNEPEEDIDKSELPEAVRKALEDAESRAEQAEKESQALDSRISKMEQERKHSAMVTKIQKLRGLPSINADDYASVFLKIEDALDADEFSKLMSDLGGAAEAIRKSDLFKEIGRGGSSGGAESEAAEKVAEMQKANPEWSEQKARAEVWKRHPDLYRRVEDERRAASTEG